MLVAKLRHQHPNRIRRKYEIGRQPFNLMKIQVGTWIVLPLQPKGFSFSSACRMGMSASMAGAFFLPPPRPCGGRGKRDIGSI